MAILISKQSGLWSDSNTWGVVDTGSYYETEANMLGLVTGFSYSASFVPSVCVVDGAAIKYAANTIGINSGITTVALVLAADSGILGSGTIDTTYITDGLPLFNQSRGWLFVKFTSTVDFTSSQPACKLGIKNSDPSINAIYFYTQSSTYSFTRMLRTTTTAVPQSGDLIHVMGQFTGIGPIESITVTMDNTGVYPFGTGTTLQSMTTNWGGVLNWPTEQSSYLKWKGVFSIYNSGVVNIGTLENPMQTGYSGVLEMDVSTNVDSALTIGARGTLNIYGYPKGPFNQGFTNLIQSFGGYCNTLSSGVYGISGMCESFTDLDNIININGTNYTIASVVGPYELYLTTSPSTMSRVGWTHSGSLSRTIYVQDITNWQIGDSIIITSSTLTMAQTEQNRIELIGDNTLILTGILSYLHLGEYPMQAEVANLTRNVIIKGKSATLQGYIYFLPSSYTSFNNAEFYWLGSATDIKRGIQLNIGAGTASFSGCSFHNWEVADSRFQTSTSIATPVLIYNNVFYKIQGGGLYISAADAPQRIIGNLICSVASANSSALTAGDLGSVYDNNAIVGMGASLSESSAWWSGSFSNNVIHTHNTAMFAIALPNFAGGVISGNRFYRSTSSNIYCSSYCAPGTNFTDCLSFGASSYSVYLQGGQSDLNFRNCTFCGDEIYLTSYGVMINQNGNYLFENCDFGPTSGVFALLSNGSIAYTLASTYYNSHGKAVCKNCSFSPIEILTQQYLESGKESYAASENHNRVSGYNKLWKNQGTIQTDTGIYQTVSPSLRLTPNSATADTNNRLKSSRFYVPLLSGQNYTSQVSVRESITGDGYRYNGEKARLWVEKESSIGIYNDILLTTATEASSGAWEILSGTSPTLTSDGIVSFYVDCGGSGYTTGWVNIGKWS